MKRACISLTIAILGYLCGYSQGILTDEQNAYRDMFSQSVKSCDEFMCRFNEEEYFPNLDSSDSDLGKKNFLLLFDYELSKGRGKDVFLQDIFHFYTTVKTNNVKLSYDGKKWYAELRADFLFKKKNIELGIVLQYEKTPTNLPCWTIVGVNGLEKIGYKDSTNRYTISPEQHESLFVEIESDFKHSSKEFSLFRGYDIKLDALSYFFALIETGNLTFQKRVLTQFHFFDVPSYAFSVKYHDRAKLNAGWLISSYRHIDENEKELLLNQLLGK